MPTLSVYPVSVTVGGRGSAILDWQKYIYTNKSSRVRVKFRLRVLREVLLQMWQPRVEIEHYFVVYFHRITVFEARRTSIKGGAHMQWVNS